MRKVTLLVIPPERTAPLNLIDARMRTSKYYSPRLDRDLISLLYQRALAEDLPMTRLTSRIIREALTSAAETSEASLVLREDPPAADPGGRS